MLTEVLSGPVPICFSQVLVDRIILYSHFRLGNLLKWFDLVDKGLNPSYFKN